MARRILTPSEKAKLVAQRADTVFARVTARYTVVNQPYVDANESAHLLRTYGLFSGYKCVYYRCENEILTVLEATMRSYDAVLAIDLLQDDATRFVDLAQGSPKCLFLHVVDANDNHRWIPGVLLKPVD